jgi:hypothetical protein
MSIGLHALSVMWGHADGTVLSNCAMSQSKHFTALSLSLPLSLSLTHTHTHTHTRARARYTWCRFNITGCVSTVWNAFGLCVCVCVINWRKLRQMAVDLTKQSRCTACCTWRVMQYCLSVFTKFFSQKLFDVYRDNFSNQYNAWTQ